MGYETVAPGVPMDLGRDRRAMGLAAASHSRDSRPQLDFERQIGMKGRREDRDCLMDYKACRYIIPQTIGASCLSIHVDLEGFATALCRGPTFSHGVSLGTSSRPSSMTLGKVDLGCHTSSSSFSNVQLSISFQHNQP
jgi:hypothetical protein